MSPAIQGKLITLTKDAVPLFIVVIVGGNDTFSCINVVSSLAYL